MLVKDVGEKIWEPNFNIFLFSKSRTFSYQHISPTLQQPQREVQAM